MPIGAFVSGWSLLGNLKGEGTDMTIKEEIVRLMQDLPDEATEEETIDEAMDRLYLLHRVLRGDKQIAEGKGISQEDVRQQMIEWRK